MIRTLATIILSLILLPSLASAQELTEPRSFEFDAVVTEVVEESLGTESEYQIVQVKISSLGEYENRMFTIDSREGLTEGLRHTLKPEQRVTISLVEDFDGNVVSVFVTDVHRLDALMLAIIIFIVVTLAVGMIRGFSSLISLAIIFVILFTLIIPQIIAGANPILITLIGSALILCFSIFITHGFNRTSTIAFAGTIAGLVITGILAVLFVNYAHLTGLSGEEAALLQLKAGLVIDTRGLLLASIIIGALGVLDDLSVNQSVAVQELKQANNSLSTKELFARAMKLGRHHIASMVNTLVLAYAGVSMPLLLLFMGTDASVLNIINSEYIAEEIIRTMVGTVGLILTVPITTWLAAYWVNKKV